jgi:pimeloyl-ACP methyl ester carboxylesterase
VPAARVLAWDAPGYGNSAPLAPMAMPGAADYAERLWAWLDALGPQAAAPLVLVGHSLGALMACAAPLRCSRRGWPGWCCWRRRRGMPACQ